jgi:hypothetical protein
MKSALSIVAILWMTNICVAQNFEWARTFGAESADLCESSAVDASGNVYTTGYFRNTVDFDPGPATANLTAPGVSPDVFVQKMDPSGNFLWARSFGRDGGDYGYSIALDEEGNVYTTGQFGGTVDFDPGEGVTELTSSGGFDIFVQKMDALGNFIWAKAFGGSGWDQSFAISSDNSGNLYITGFYEETADFDPGEGTTNFTVIGNRDAFVQKLDSDGNLLWARSFGGTDFELGRSAQVDASGNVYVAGYFGGAVDLDPGAGEDNYTSAGFRDIFIQKLDASGNFLWAKRFGGSASEEPEALTVDAAGNVYATGFFGGTTDFDPSPETFNLTAAGTLDAFALKLDDAGNLLWVKSIGGSGAVALGKSISVDEASNVYLTGVFSESVDFDPGAGTANLSSNGGYDMFVQKMDESGDFVWANSFGGPEFDWALTISVAPTGSVYTTGWFRSTVDFDPGSGTNSVSSSGNGDVFVQKLSQDLTGIPELSSSILVSAYPNPSQGTFLLSFDQSVPYAVVTLTDMQGKVIFIERFDATVDKQIQIDGPEGVYILNVETPRGKSVSKLIKN